jgi:hypothetical protein
MAEETCGDALCVCERSGEERDYFAAAEHPASLLFTVFDGAARSRQRC